MLKIKPSMKIKRRYLLIEGKKEDIEKSILDYIGILGWTKAAPIFVKNYGSKNILAVERASLDQVIASFAICEGNVKVLKVSGTLKGLGKYEEK